MTEYTVIRRLISDIIALLVQENEHIKQGDYRLVNASSAEKSKKMLALETALLDVKSPQAEAVLRPELERMQKHASINTVLLSAAINGVKSANDRVSAILNQERQTGTYDRRGRSVEMSETQAMKIKVL